MRKILTAALLLFPAAQALPASAGDNAGLAGSPVFTAEPVRPPSETASPQGPAPQTGLSDLDLFRQNASDNPREAAAALLRLLPPKTEAEIQAFKAEQAAKLAEMVFSLYRQVRDGALSREDYFQIRLGLAPFNLYTRELLSGAPGATTMSFQPGTDGARPPGGGRTQRRDPVDSLVDVHSARDAGDRGRADAAMAAAIEQFPQLPAVHSAAAAYYNENKNYKAAEREASAAIALDPSDPDAYKARAVARAALEDRKGAIEDIRKAVAEDPHDESARVLSALIESRKTVPTLRSISSLDEIKRSLGDAGGESDAAVKGFGSGARAGAAGPDAGQAGAAPDYARSKAYLKTALSKTRLGDYAAAAHYATLAIEKDPANLEAYLERANANNFLGRFDDAVRDAGYVIEREPSNMQAFNVRAWALNQKGSHGDAAADASKAIGINPAYADAWFNRALAYEKQGDYKRMLEDFRQAAALSGAYASRYQDAVAQYGPRVPGYAGAAQARAAAAAAAEGAAAPAGRPPLKRFLMLLFFTLTGGALVAAGLVHILGSRQQGPAAGRVTHPDVLSPSVFYEGVATGKYKIERKLGEGAMGVVYEATDQSLGRKVAIKRMGEEIKVNDREKQRFLEEARTVALLHHPGVVEIYTIFEEEGSVYLVFEHVEGQTLDRLVDKEGRLAWDSARRLFSEAAAALAYAHSKNVVHRDLKLANIMLSSEGSVKVMDFGLAYRARESAARMSGGEVVGSPAYMAPEQELGASSARSDIYSLGVCLYEALSGVLPFQGPDFHQQKTRLACQRLTDAVPGLPRGLDEVIAKCLAPDPENRYRGAEELKADLDALA